MHNKPFLIASNQLPPRAQGGRDSQVRPARTDCFEALRRRAAYRPTLADDFRDVIGEIRAAPVSHALVAIGAVVGWTVLLVAPLLIGGGK